MPKRGSVQLLLLSFRSRAALGWGALPAIFIVTLGWFFHGQDDFPVLTKTGLAQVIREAAWEHALAGSAEEPWPLENASQTTNPKVQQEMKAFFQQHGVKSVAMSDGNMGCPHEEGEDFPVGKDCPFCPFWKGKQGSNRPE